MVSGRVIRKPLSEKMFETLTDLIFAVDSLSVSTCRKASLFFWRCIMLNRFRSYQASVALYHKVSVLKLPRHLSDQVQRASSSVALNLAEGAGKTSFLEKKKFYTSALASLREVQAVLELARLRDEVIITEASQLGGMIYKLIQWRP